MPTTHDSKPRVFACGPLIISVESLFWHIHRYPRRRVAPARPPLTERAAPRELEQPYRRGEGRVLRIPLLRRGVVVGYWVPAIAVEDESAAIVEALDGMHLPGITATEIKEWPRSRGVDVLTLWDRLRERVRQWRARWSDPLDVVLEEDDVEYTVIPWSARS